MKILVALFATISLVSIATAAPTKSKWIDLTYDLHNNMIHWPGLTPYNHTLTLRIENEYFNVERYAIRTSEHMGTHIEAPRHFAKGKLTMDQVPLDAVIGDAVVINMTAKAAKDQDALLMTSDLEEWEKTNGRIPDEAVVFLYTGWGKYWGNEKLYLGTDTGNTSLLHFPGIHSDAIQWLVDKRKIKLYGVDCISTDAGQTQIYPAHAILAKNNIPGIENLANLDKLPAKGATVFALPIKIAQGSAAPARVVATIKDPGTSGAWSNARGMLTCAASLAMVFVLSIFV